MKTQAHSWMAIAWGGAPLVLAAICPTGLMAQDFGATATVEAPILSDDVTDPTQTVTTIGVPADSEDLASALDGAPGGTVVRAGGAGSFSGVSIRGLSLEHTQISLEGQSLGSPGEAFDLSVLPASWFESLDVYRGGAPLRFGQSPVGGLVNLRLRAPSLQRRSEMFSSLGGGSFGTARALVATRVDDGRGMSFFASAFASHTDGDFSYLNDGGTPLSDSDDQVLRRSNGELTEGGALLHLRAPLLSGELSLLSVLVGRTGGVQGTPLFEPDGAARAETRALGRVSFASAGFDSARPERIRYRLSVGGQVSRQRFQDPLGKIALVPRATDDAQSNWDLAGLLEVPISSEWHLGAHSSYRLETRDPEDQLARTPNPAVDRHSARLGLESVFQLRLGEGRTQIRPSASVSLVDGRVEPNARLGWVLEPAPFLSVVASVSTGARFPSFGELFGDRGYLLPEPDLRPERSLAADLGLVGRVRAEAVAASFELRGFAVSVTDMIRYVRTSQFRLRPQNIGEARTLGLEAQVSTLWARLVRLTLSSTLQDPVDRATGKTLSLRPSFRLHAQAQVSLANLIGDGGAQLGMSVSHTSRTFADLENIIPIPGRTVVSVFLGLEPLPGLGIRFRVEDLFDEQPFDLVGYPLPGRRFSLDVSYTLSSESSSSESP